MSVRDTVRETMISHNMICRGGVVAAGLSGGADSVCLLLVLDSLKEELGFSLKAVHVNHCLRGEESERDMHFCEELCAAKGIPIEIFRVDVRKLRAETGKSTEEAARVLRYEAFEKALDGSTGRIATAHNKCDNSETVLFNLSRGTGVRGMSGIPYVRGNIIRPLLRVSRREIEEYLKAAGQAYVTDSTNLINDCSRNIIRLDVIPRLESINSGFHEAVSRLSECAGEDEEYFEELLRNIPESDIVKYPAAVRKRYIRKKLTEGGGECTYERICEFDRILSSGIVTKQSLSGGLYAVFNGKMTVEKQIVPEKIFFEKIVAFNGNSSIYISEFDKTVKIKAFYDDISRDCLNVNRKLTNNLVNCDRIKGVVILRCKKDGDRIAFKGRNFETRLKKLYNSLKLSPEERLRALVMEDGEGIIWSEYGGVSRRVCALSGDDPKRLFAVYTE